MLRLINHVYSVFFVFSLSYCQNMQQLLLRCLSWERDPYSVTRPEVSSIFWPVKAVLESKDRG